MAKLKNTHIDIRIKDQSGEIEQILHVKDRLTVGRKLDNDILVYDQTYPRSHSLIKCQKDQSSIFLHPSMSGQLRYRDSKISLEHLIIHDILPKENGFYHLKVLPGHSGMIKVGDKHVYFQYNHAQRDHVHHPDFSWRSATRKALFKDGAFKLLLLLFLSFEAWWIWHINHTELPPVEPPQSQQAQKRFARFIIQDKKPEPEQIAGTQVGQESSGTAEEQESSSDDQKPDQSRTNKRSTSTGGSEKAVESAGLLGLIGGSGTSNQSSQAVDFLLDKGVADNLDKVMQTQRLQKGKRIGSGSGDGTSGNSDMDALDDLLAMGAVNNVDDIVSSDSDFEEVRLEKKGQINISRPQSMRGSSQAKADRSAQDVMAIINGQHGRIMYTYNKYLRQNPSLGGKITLDVTIQASGRVSQVKVVESTITNKNFITEVVGIIKRLRFKAINSGAVTVNLPFVFHRQS